VFGSHAEPSQTSWVPPSLMTPVRDLLCQDRSIEWHHEAARPLVCSNEPRAVK
jgi:hypothetical protein